MTVLLGAFLVRSAPVVLCRDSSSELVASRSSSMFAASFTHTSMTVFLFRERASLYADEVKKGISLALGRPDVAEQLQVQQLWRVLPSGQPVLVPFSASVQGRASYGMPTCSSYVKCRCCRHMRCA